MGKQVVFGGWCAGGAQQVVSILSVPLETPSWCPQETHICMAVFCFIGTTLKSVGQKALSKKYPPKIPYPLTFIHGVNMLAFACGKSSPTGL